MATLSEATQRELNGLQTLDPQIIGPIYDHYFSDVYRFVLYRLNDENLAEDISSDVFVSLLEASKKNIKASLISTASHIITDHFRRHYRRPITELPKNLIGRIPRIRKRITPALAGGNGCQYLNGPLCAGWCCP